MITYTTGNLLECPADALVNTVNTVGVMGKGIALMFKEKFPQNFDAYAHACKEKAVRVGSMFVTERRDLVDGPRWIVNFPTKQHWRQPSKEEWIREGLRDLARFIVDHGIGSIAIPPLGSGNGGLDWARVKPLIEAELGQLANVAIVVFEPTSHYQNVAKREGVEKLTPARALVAELVRRYAVLGLECSLLEIQKLAYLLGRSIERLQLDDPLKLEFKANRYGPFAHKLDHLLNGLDGSYLHAPKRVADSGPFDTITFDERKRERVALYLRTEAKPYLPALEAVSAIIEGFESPVGMELLATVDWLARVDRVPLEVPAMRDAIGNWLGGGKAAARKASLFNDRIIGLAVERLISFQQKQESSSA